MVHAMQKLKNILESTQGGKHELIGEYTLWGGFYFFLWEGGP